MASIFDRIFWYRQSNGRTPSEDYFTELFSAVLEKCEALGTTIVGKLISLNDITTARIQTQKYFRSFRRRVDMYATMRDGAGREHVMIIESKLDSVQAKNQLADYIEILVRHRDATTRTLIYVTRKSEELDVPTLENQQPNVSFKHLRWSQVYDWIKERTEALDGHDAAWKELLNELLALMEDWNMGGEISARSMRAALVFHNSLDSEARLVQEFIDPAWDKSDIDNFLGPTNGNWSFKNYPYSWQTSPRLTNFRNVRIAMGFRFDRRDEVWNVDDLELPSAAVTVVRGDADDFPRPSRKWQPGPVDGMDEGDLWFGKPGGPLVMVHLLANFTRISSSEHSRSFVTFWVDDPTTHRPYAPRHQLRGVHETCVRKAAGAKCEAPRPDP